LPVAAAIALPVTAGIGSAGRLPSAARAASALVTAFSTVSGDVPFSRCLRITSWRCLSRRRSSRQAPMAATRSVTRRVAHVPIALAIVPNESWVTISRERNRAVRTRTSAPVRLKSSVSRRAVAVPRTPPAGIALPPTVSVPKPIARSAPLAAKSTRPPASFVQGAVSARTQK
jgi:hypothetical protein